MLSEDDNILQAFIAGSLEHLADIEQDFLAPENQGSDSNDLLSKVIRTAHSITGGAAFMGLSTIQALAHVTENVLDLIGPLTSTAFSAMTITYPTTSPFPQANGSQREQKPWL